MKAASESTILAVTAILSLTLTTCGSSSSSVIDPCEGVNECEFAGQKTCQSDTQYRQCYVDTRGCLVWDCST